MVENKTDLFGEYWGVELVDGDLAKVLVYKLLSTHNILEHCRSKKVVYEAIQEYGGKLLLSENLKEAKSIIQTSKGNLFWVYAKGNLTTGVNSLADFDIFFIHSYIYKTEKQYDKEHLEEVFNYLKQAISRVLSTVK